MYTRYALLQVLLDIFAVFASVQFYLLVVVVPNAFQRYKVVQAYFEYAATIPLVL